MLTHSPFLAQIMRLRPACLHAILSSAPEERFEAICVQTEAAARQATSLDDLMPLLRRFRAEAALLVALTDCGGVWGVDEAVAAISRMADLCAAAAIDYLLRKAAERGAFQPLDPENPGKGSGLVVLAMGKHGARELNYSSDIDLVVFYDPEIAEARASPSRRASSSS